MEVAAVDIVIFLLIVLVALWLLRPWVKHSLNSWARGGAVEEKILGDDHQKEMAQ